MRIHELVPYDGIDLIIHNEDTGHTLVLTPFGAVYNNEDTSDLRNIAIAFGVLFTSDKWRMATTEEVKEFREREEEYLLELHWSTPQPKVVQLTLVKKEI